MNKFNCKIKLFYLIRGGIGAKCLKCSFDEWHQKMFSSDKLKYAWATRIQTFGERWENA